MFEAPGGKLGVVVEQQQHLSACDSSRFVARLDESPVLVPADYGCPVEAAEQFRGAVGGLIVDNDDLERRVRHVSQGAQAGQRELGTVVQHEEHRDARTGEARERQALVAPEERGELDRRASASAALRVVSSRARTAPCGSASRSGDGEDISWRRCL